MASATDPLAGLRARTAVLHRQLESTAVFSRLTRDDVGLADVSRAMVVFHAFYAGLEQVLPPRLADSPHAGLYRPRRGLLASDLAGLGVPAPAPLTIALPATDAGLLGVIYAVEGSALGGQVLTRHLGARLGCEFSYFSDLAEGVGGHWQRVLASLRQALVDQEQLDEVIAGATLVFSSLIRLAEGEQAGGHC